MALWLLTMSGTDDPEVIFGSCSCVCDDNTTEVCRVEEPTEDVDEEPSDEIIRLEFLTNPLAGRCSD